MAVRLLLLPLLVVLLHGWGCAATINLQLTWVPGAATRIVVVVDEGGLSAPKRFVKDVTAGASSATLALVDILPGGPYRVRAIAYVAGLAYPAILLSGKTTVVLASNQTSVSAAITLTDLNAVRSTATPPEAQAGSSVTLAADIFDPGDTGAGAGKTYLYSLDTPLSGNQGGHDLSGPFERMGGGNYRLSAIVAAPQVGRTLYYQFAYKAWDFQDATNVEAPTWFWPNLNAGGVSLQLAAQGSSSISVIVEQFPAAGNRIVVVVDGGALQRPVRVAKDYTAGQTSTTMTVNVPAASGYRVRVVAYAYAVGRIYPAILRSGKVIGVAAPSSTTITLADPAFSPGAGTPDSAPAGSIIALGATLTDPGDAAAGTRTANLVSGAAPFISNLGGTLWQGLLEGIGLGKYLFSVPLTVPATATTYYQFAANALDFNDPSGLESPHFFWPNLEAGAPPLALMRINSGAPLYTITGKVTLNGAGLAGVAVALPGKPSAVTAADGAYSFTALPAGSYTVTPALSNFTFSAPSSTLTLASNQTLNFIASQITGTIRVTVSELPPGSNRIVAVVDRPGLQPLARVVQDYAVGQLSAAMNIVVPTGTGYRIRIVAFAAGSTSPVILCTGKATGLLSTANPVIVLAEPTFTPLAGTPASAPAGTTVSLEATLTDPGDAAAGVAAASVYSQPQMFTANLTGTKSAGSLKVESGGYRVAVLVKLPDGVATTYYQFVANAFDFNQPSGSESPYFIWPNLQAGKPPREIAATISSSIIITVSGTPSRATRIIALVDQGGLTNPLRAVANFIAGQAPASVTVGVPPGGPYRVRLVALRSGTATPVILRSGKAAGVRTSNGATAAVWVALTEYTVALDAATPSAAPAGAAIRVIAKVTDPGETASGATASRLYGAISAFTQNLSAAPVSGLLEKNADGTLKLSIAATLPAISESIYYQLAYEAPEFSDAEGLERPFFCWPNLDTAQALKQIAAIPAPLHTISGRVTHRGVAVGGVTVKLTGMRTATFVTAADGAYSFTGLPDGPYTVTVTPPNPPSP